MKRLNRHLQKPVLLSITVILLLIVSLDALFTFIDELRDLENDYQIKQAASYLLLSIPQKINEFIPYAVLLGALFGLGRLANQNELIVMRAAGVSVIKIIRAILVPVMLFVVLGVVLSEWVIPITETKAETNRLIAKGDWDKISENGYWHRERHQFVHINAFSNQQEILGITIYTLNENQELIRTQRARSAQFENSAWQLQDVWTTDISPSKTETSHAEKAAWATNLIPSLLKVVMSNPDYLSSSDLWRYSQFLQNEMLEASPHALAFWRNVLQPIAIISLLLLATTTIFGSQRHLPMSFRVFLGVLIGLSFKYLQDLLGPASLVYGFTPLLAALLPIILVLSVAAIFLRRA